MLTKPLALAAFAYALLTAAASAASLDLASRGLTQGDLIATTDLGEIDFSADATLGYISITVSDAPNLEGTAFAISPSPMSLGVDVFSPTKFSGDLVDYDVDATSAVGLFSDGMGTYLLGELALPAGTAFTPNGFFISGVTISLYEVNPTAVVPLPAAAPLLLAGLGALAALRRRAA